MGRGLSDQQIKILAYVHHGRQRVQVDGVTVPASSFAAILVDLFGFPTTRPGCFRSAREGYVLGSRLIRKPHTDVFDRRQVGPARYDSVRASVYRALARLWKRALIARWVGGGGTTLGYLITDAGRTYLEERGLLDYDGRGPVPGRAGKATAASNSCPPGGSDP